MVTSTSRRRRRAGDATVLLNWSTRPCWRAACRPRATASAKPSTLGDTRQRAITRSTSPPSAPESPSPIKEQRKHEQAFHSPPPLPRHRRTTGALGALSRWVDEHRPRRPAPPSPTQALVCLYLSAQRGNK